MSSLVARRRTSTAGTLYSLALVVGVLAIVFLPGCRKAEEVAEQPVQAEEQVQQQQEAERREQATRELAQRVDDVSAAADKLRQEAVSLDGSRVLESSTDELVEEVGAAAPLLQELRLAEGRDWERAAARLEAALEELLASRKEVEAKISDWESQEQTARAARDPLVLPIDEATGLLEGLDGGEYPHYKVSVVERVQRELRREGLYAGPADGYFDVTVRAAVGRFQERHELYVSGVPSPMTRSRLFAEQAES